MRMNLPVANDVSKEHRGFNLKTNEVYIIDPKRDVLHIALTTERDSYQVLYRVRDRIKA